MFFDKYYPFGMMMPGRKFDATGTYRYGFNGKEIDKEAFETSVYDYGFRIYNPAVGRFLSVDPLVQKFPFWSPYQYAGNTPVNTIDIDGLEVPVEKNKNKTETSVYTAFGAVDFSGAKAKRGEYETVTSMGSLDRNAKTFGMNSAKAVWNQLVDFGETAVNITSVGGRMKIMGESVIPMVQTIFVDWPGMNPLQRVEFIKRVATDPETYENLLASLTLAVITDKFLPSIKLPVPKEFEPIATKIRRNLNYENLGSEALDIPPMQQQPFTKEVNSIKIQFGKGENQIYHAFRHIDDMNLDRSTVQSTIENHFKTVSSQVVAGKPFNQIIEIGGHKIQYTAYKLSDNTYNIGRIHAVN